MAADDHTPDQPTAEALTPAPEAETPAAEAGTPAAEAGTPAAEAEMPAAEAEMPAAEAETPAPEGAKPSLSQIKRLQSGHGPKRKRKPSAAQRHRGLFFARLNELRRAERAGEAGPSADADPASAAPAATDSPAPEASVTEAAPQAEAAETTEATPQAEATEATEAPQAEATEAPQAEATETTEAAPQAEATETTEATPQAEATETTEAPQAEATETTEASSEVQRPARPKKTPPAPLQGVAVARVQAAIQRVGGPDVIKAALAPQQDASGQPLKWAAVCAEKSIGLKPGDPAFQAWLRLAATPVREVKGQLRALTGEDDRDTRGRGPGGRREGGRGRGRSDGDRGPGRGPRSDRPASRQELQALGRDGSLSAKVRIVTESADDERREREKQRKAAKEAKRQAERERLSRLGY